MTTASGSGQGNVGVQAAFQFSQISITSFTDTSIVANGKTFTGTGFTYTSSAGPGGSTIYQPTGGTITGVSTGTQTWSGFSVPLVTAFNNILNADAFNDLFFSGDDTLTWSGVPLGAFAATGLYAGSGNDTINISNWNTVPTTSDFIDGGAGTDTINLTGGLVANPPGSNVGRSNFLARNIETINLGAGSNYIFQAQAYLVFSGNTLTINASALGAGNTFSFAPTSLDGTPAGNLVLIGGAGNDVFQGGSGNDTLDGGSGLDKATYSGSFAAYAIRHNSNGSVTITGPGGTDTLTHFESVVFDDQTVSLLGNQAPVADFNGDGRSDILWQNDNSQAALWLLNGFTQIGSNAVGGTPGPSWHIRGPGDFNGDGNADVLWQNDNGQAAIWLMNGFTQIGNDAIGGDPGPSWHIKGAGDFNGDGKADILWQNDNGQAALWLVNGLTQIGNDAIGGDPGPTWHIKGTGDFNGDSKADILWQNDNGQAALWLMNGFAQIGNGAIGGNPDPSWHIKGTGDFNGDGKADVLWQNDNGQAALWLMNGFAQIGSDAVGANPDPSWHIKTAADTNGDGLSDILWQGDSGQAMVWQMSGTNILSNSTVGPNPGTSWHIIAASS